MKRTLSKLIGLFVDDGAFALAIVAWAAAAGIVLAWLPAPPASKGPVLVAGLVAILVDSALRRARR